MRGECPALIRPWSWPFAARAGDGDGVLVKAARWVLACRRSTGSAFAIPRLPQRKKQLAILERLLFDTVMVLKMRPVVGHGSDSFLGATGFELAAYHIIKPQAIGITLCGDA